MFLSSSTRKLISQTIVLDFLAPRLSFAPQNTLWPQAPRWISVTPAGPSQCRFESTIAPAQSNSPKSDSSLIAKSSNSSLADVANDIRRTLAALTVPLSGTDELLEGLRNKQYLGRPELVHLSRAIVRECDSLGCDSTWGDRHREAVEALAIIAASRGFWEGLHQLMVLYLREGHLPRLFSLYQRYTDRSSSEDEIFEDNQLDSNGHVKQSDKNMQKVENSLLAVAVAAHATQDSFQDALTLVLGSQKALLTERATLPVIHLFDEQKDLQDRVQAYFRVLSTAALVQRSILPSHIRKLQTEKQVDAIHEISNTLIDAYKGPVPWAAINQDQLSKSRPIIVPEKHWAVIILAFVKSGREDFAEQLWDQILAVGLRPGLIMWRALLEAYRGLRRLQDVLNTWNAMIADGCKPDAAAYCEKIYALFAERKKRAALGTFEEFKTQRTQDDGDIVVFNAVLHGLLKEDEEDAAKALLSQMMEKGPEPDIVSFNTFLKFHDRRSNLTALLETLEKIVERGLQPDVITFTTVLSAFLRAGQPNAAQNVVETMKKMGIELNTATYTAIITHQLQSGSNTDIRMAMDVLDQMESSKDIHPNFITYTSFLTGLHRSQDPELIMKLSQDIVGRMKRRGLRIRRGVYHILLKACFQNPDPKAVEKAMEYYSEMVKSGISLSHDTWYFILQNLWVRREWEVGANMVKNMLDSGFVPSRSTRVIMHRILSRRARPMK